MITQLELGIISKIISNNGNDYKKEYSNSVMVDDSLFKIKNEGYVIPRQISYASYNPQYLTYVETYNDSLSFSDDFSGCCLVRFGINNKLYIGHISIESGSQWDKSGIQWEKFVKEAKINHYILFFPYHGKVKEIYERLIISQKYPVYNGINCFGIIDEQKLCYSGIYDKLNNKIIYLQQWYNVYDDTYYSRQTDGEVFINEIPLIIR